MKEKKDLRIVFMGTPEFAVGQLDAIIEAGYNVVGVVTVIYLFLPPKNCVMKSF